MKKIKINSILKKFNVKNIQKIKKLKGYESFNFLIQTQQQKYILKIHNNEYKYVQILEAENEILNHLNQSSLSFEIPFSYPTSKGKNIIALNENQQIRLLSYIEGSFLAEVKHSKKLLQSFGKSLAELNSNLSTINNPFIESKNHDWDNKNAIRNKNKTKWIKNPSHRRIVEYFYMKFEEIVLPQMPQLRKSIIHGDANDWNVLVEGDKIKGFIDFGDICYSPLINDLAIGIAYLLFDKKDPLKTAKIIVQAYHKVFALEEKELELLYYLIAIRLCVSVSNSTYDYIQNPENEYIIVSQASIWKVLQKWIQINPLKAETEFKKVCRYTTSYPNTIENNLNQRKKHFSSSLSLSYQQPIQMKGAGLQYMYAADGKTYLDAYNNIPIVGHCHPRVVKAGQQKMAELNTNTRYLYDILYEYSEKLLSKFPKKLNKVFFVNSGSAASDLAIRLAKNHTKNEKIVVLENAYHGNTNLGIEISSYKYKGKGGQGISKNIIEIPMPDSLRGKYKNEGKNKGNLYAKDAIKTIKKNHSNIAAFIAEPILGCGGQMVLPQNYLQNIFQYIRSKGGLCIIDEVQVGFGRVGTHFWGFEQHGVIPDIVILGKPIGNGHPMGAVVCTEEVAESFNNGMEFFSSFGGNPVSCAIGLEVLKVIEEEKLQSHSLEVGNYIMNELKNFKNEFSIIGDVRGSGLFWGLELVENKSTLVPATLQAQTLKNYLKEEQILIGTDGPYNNVIKSKPPLCFNHENADLLLTNIHQWLKKNT